MANKKRGTLEDLGNRLRGLLEDVERLLNPQQPKPIRVPVPVPVRAPRTSRRDPYGR